MESILRFKISSEFKKLINFLFKGEFGEQSGILFSSHG